MRQPISTSAIYEDLKQKIMKGELHSGEFLFETQLAESYGVSRTPVRQAIKLLDADGLLANIPRKGTYVKFLSTEDVISVYQAAEALEGMAVSLLSLQEKHDFSTLEQLNLQMNSALNNDDITSWCYLDETFHANICQNCGNEVIARLYDSLKINMRRVRIFYSSLWHNKEISCTEHAELIEYMKSGNRTQASVLISKHYRNVIKQAVSILNLESSERKIITLPLPPE